MKKFTFIIATALLFSLSAAWGKSNVVQQHTKKITNSIKALPTGVEVKDNVITKWDAEIPEKLVIPEGIVGIADNVFYMKPVKEIVFPKTLKSIGKNAFAYCNSIETINLFNGLEVIAESAFYQCHNLRLVNVPKTIKIMGPNAFAYCDKLVTLNLEDGLTLIGESAFFGCKMLEKINLPKSLTSIDENAFGECTSINNMVIPEGITTIMDRTFQGCTNLASVKLPKTLESIKKTAFSNCEKLEEIELPQNLKLIEPQAFSGCSSLKSITIPEGIDQIQASTFENCSSLNKIQLPSSITLLNHKAFKDCKSLQTIDLTNIAIKTIGNFVFQNCSNLESITLPASLKTMGLNTFTGCNKLSKVVCKATTPPTIKGSFNKTPDSKVLYVPESAVEDYKKEWGKAKFSNIEPIKEEKKEPETKKDEKVAIFNFAENPWKVPTAKQGDKPEVAKIEDGTALTIDGISLTFQKLHERYWNRIMDGNLKAYIHNTITFTAPQNVTITKIEFFSKPYECDFEEITQTGGKYYCADDDNSDYYIWDGKAPVIKFKDTNNNTIKKIKVTYISDKTDGVKNIKTNITNDSKIYNIRGIAVGKYKDLSTLPKGIYIVNGTKIIKN